MDTLIAGLLAWIVARTGMLTPPPPQVHYVPQTQLAEMFYGWKHENGARVKALYWRDDEAIYLVEGWREDNVRSMSELLHELVHHVQKFNHVELPCLAAYERQAYDLHIAWLREQGVADPYALLETDEFTIMILSRCSAD